ncbi:RNB domain-containing ribonuclease [Actinoalloteichus hymeniacidonis]|uniref:Exoribonuclease R n=1 Tax=Actinoalloteichus hymeniacidonis TaxID=340345 RepID=A0AAC9HT34_9PSEU|nr:RNB domain-containing ribonuclease [Actinoalloteichus hymeniacidonis]AOS65187.1 exoribonuclease R [Actinoalloteichus hymeniacidonis]MBB5906733.1 exoribonuclease R [Actinoalloteichus hymeniacidonis]
MSARTSRSADVSLDFTRVRAEFGLPSEFPPGVLAEAQQAVGRDLAPGPRRDATALPLVSIDPPGAKDLDQIMYLQRRARGYRVHYAIADLGAFVVPGGLLDREVRSRGQTLYLPDGIVPMHPPVLSEDAASLLPDRIRPAVLWTMDLDADGELESTSVCRAVVRSTACLDFDMVAASLRAGSPHPSIALLPEIGRLRRALALRRGAIELGLPDQQVVPDGAGGWRPALRRRVEIDDWNAEISLLTGMAAAQIMLTAGVGVLRTLPDPDEQVIARLRDHAEALGVEWPAGAGPAQLLAGLDSTRPEAMALYLDATRLLRGAGYTAFDSGAPSHSGHAGIGAPYAHVTAPLRRLVDRFGTEICLAVTEGSRPAEWALAALPKLPSLMGSSDQIAGRVERACVSQSEAWVLASRVGHEFEATVLRIAGTTGEIFITDPPVATRCEVGAVPPGGRLRVRLTSVDPETRKVRFEAVPPEPIADEAIADAAAWNAATIAGGDPVPEASILGARLTNPAAGSPRAPAAEADR